MVFELDTKDMERHKVELRLALDKARRRFEKAQMEDLFQDIVKRQLPSPSDRPNVLEIDRISNEENQRLRSFLHALIEGCQREDQFALLQDTLRYSLQESRRRSVTVDPTARLVPMCLFCASDLNSARHFNQCSDQVNGNPASVPEETPIEQVQPQTQHDLRCIRGPETPIETPSPDPQAQPENLSYRVGQEGPAVSLSDAPPVVNPGLAHRPNLAANIEPEPDTNASTPLPTVQSRITGAHIEPAPCEATYSPQLARTGRDNLDEHLRRMEAENESRSSTPFADAPDEDSMQAEFFDNDQREDEFQRVSTPKPGNESQSLSALVDFSDKAAKFGPFQPFRNEKPRTSIDALVDKLKLRAQSPSVPTHSRLVKAPTSEPARVSIVINRSVERPPPPLTPPQPTRIRPQAVPATDKPHLSSSKPVRMHASKTPKPARAPRRNPARNRTQPVGESTSSSASSSQPIAQATNAANSKSTSDSSSSKQKRVKHKHTPRRGPFRSSTQPA